MKIKGKYSESFPMYAAFLAAGAVAAIIGFCVIFNSLGGIQAEKPAEDKPQQTEEVHEDKPPQSSGYTPDEEEKDKMYDAAIELIGNNYEVIKLYYTKGMSHEDEPYGNIPEDNYYTVKSSTYTSIDQLNELVDSTYTEAAANEVKTDPLGYGAIYAARDNGSLGIIYGYTPMDYDISWENPKFSLVPESADKCGITVTVHVKSTSEETELSGVMEKTDNGWRLSSVIM